MVACWQVVATVDVPSQPGKDATRIRTHLAVAIATRRKNTAALATLRQAVARAATQAAVVAVQGNSPPRQHANRMESRPRAGLARRVSHTAHLARHAWLAATQTALLGSIKMASAPPPAMGLAVRPAPISIAPHNTTEVASAAAGPMLTFATIVRKASSKLAPTRLRDVWTADTAVPVCTDPAAVRSNSTTTRRTTDSKACALPVRPLTSRRSTHQERHHANCVQDAGPASSGAPSARLSQVCVALLPTAPSAAYPPHVSTAVVPVAISILTSHCTLPTCQIQLRRSLVLRSLPTHDHVLPTHVHVLPTLSDPAVAVYATTVAIRRITVHGQEIARTARYTTTRLTTWTPEAPAQYATTCFVPWASSRRVIAHLRKMASRARSARLESTRTLDLTLLANAPHARAAPRESTGVNAAH